MTRVSVRSYKATAIETEKITTILKAGMAAPSGLDKRPWHFIVVTDKKQIHALSKANPGSEAIINNAPLIIVVCGDMNKADKGSGHDNWILDTSAASENILLAAHALGLGAVWTGVYPREERINKVSEVLNLPKEIIPLSAILIGYPDNEATPKDKWNENDISYDRYKVSKSNTEME